MPDNKKREFTSFQTGANYDSRMHIPADVAMVYGINNDLPKKVEGWRKAGYTIQLMTGVAWGEYKDYLYGQWDGKNHWDEAQRERNGEIIGHGVDVPYMAPSITYGLYLADGVKRAIDQGIDTIFLEEPEFWVRAGYSESFKREWQSYYKEPWQAPYSSPEAQYRASKLKYFLYRRALQQVFSEAQKYGKTKGMNVRCFVPTHSMINYAQWGIVSPEHSLAQLEGCDGYIGQVWTGTARTPNLYRGVLKERTFETAFLEYGVLSNLVKGTGRRMIYLNDPVEDQARDWVDFKMHWENTLVASLLWPEVFHYEVCPWPERPFTFKYPAKAGQPESRISKEYETELLTVFHALGYMKQPKFKWESGMQGVGVLVSDTLMFQRFEPFTGDPHLSCFFGQAIPFIKAGVAAQPVQLENVLLKDYLKPFKLLCLSYEGQKPPAAELHAPVVEWVKAGGTLLIVDAGNDPANKVREWWNTGEHSYATPMDHLLELLGLPAGCEETIKTVGKGHVIISRKNPTALAADPKGAAELIALAQKGFSLMRRKWTAEPAFVLRRGPYVVAAALDDVDRPASLQLKGRFVDLFDARLPILDGITLKPGDRKLLVDLNAASKSPGLIACAGKCEGVEFSGGKMTLRVEGPVESQGAALLRVPKRPSRVSGAEWVYDEATRTLTLHFANKPEGVVIEVE